MIKRCNLTDEYVITHAGRVAVLMGGPSAEREISIRSGTAVLKALRRVGVNAVEVCWDGDLSAQIAAVRPDRAFIALHGRGGEDGCAQGALDVAQIPYTGSGVLGCALAMDKVRSKLQWRSVGLPTPEFLVVSDTEDAGSAIQRLGLPLMVKPAREGSSIGISKVEHADELPQAIADAKHFDDTILIEKFIAGSEYTLSILGTTTLPIIKLETPRKFYDYEAKYHANTTRYLCPAGLSEADERTFASVGLKAFAALAASGWGRVDFMVDVHNNPWLIELNTVPGMTDHSLVPMAAAYAGLSFDQLVIRILASSFRRTDVV